MALHLTTKALTSRISAPSGPRLPRYRPDRRRRRAAPSDARVDQGRDGFAGAGRRKEGDGLEGSRPTTREPSVVGERVVPAARTPHPHMSVCEGRLGRDRSGRFVLAYSQVVVTTRYPSTSSVSSAAVTEMTSGTSRPRCTRRPPRDQYSERAEILAGFAEQPVGRHGGGTVPAALDVPRPYKESFGPSSQLRLVEALAVLRPRDQCNPDCIERDQPPRGVHLGGRPRRLYCER
jgi:hypothetical protein